MNIKPKHPIRRTPTSLRSISGIMPTNRHSTPLLAASFLIKFAHKLQLTLGKRIVFVLQTVRLLMYFIVLGTIGYCASHQIGITRISPVSIPSDVKVLVTAHNNNGEVKIGQKIKFLLANNIGRSKSAELGFFGGGRSSRRDNRSNISRKWFWCFQLKPLVSLLHGVHPQKYGTSSLNFYSRRFSVVSQGYIDRDWSAGDKCIWCNAIYKIRSLILLELTPRITHLFQLPTHNIPLQVGDTYRTNRYKGDEAGKSNHPFFSSINPILKKIYFGLAALLAYGICCYAIWLIHHNWNIRALLFGLLLYILAGTLVFHGFWVMSLT